MTKYYSKDVLKELRNKIPINDLIAEHLNIPYKISEGYFRFLCPICNEFQTATNSKTNLARCFTCEKNYNPIDMVMHVKRLSFVDTVEYLREFKKEEIEICLKSFH